VFCDIPARQHLSNRLVADSASPAMAPTLVYQMAHMPPAGRGMYLEIRSTNNDRGKKKERNNQARSRVIAKTQVLDRWTWPGKQRTSADE